MKKYLIDKFEKLLIISKYPKALQARLSGCYFELYSEVFQLYSMGINPASIIDVGANRGMFSRCASFLFPDAEIHAFEPLQDCFKELCALKPKIKNFDCYNLALSDFQHKSFIHRSNYDYSSSLLEMGNIHKDAFPYTSVESLESVNVETLDNIFEEKNLKRPILMKIDVQGNEGAVISGGKKIIEKTDYLICEMSFVPLYTGQVLFNDLYQSLIGFGFSYLGQLGELKHPKSNKTLQIDALFIRQDTR